MCWVLQWCLPANDHRMDDCDHMLMMHADVSDGLHASVSAADVVSVETQSVVKPSCQR